MPQGPVQHTRTLKAENFQKPSRQSGKGKKLPDRLVKKGDHRLLRKLKTVSISGKPEWYPENQSPYRSWAIRQARARYHITGLSTSQALGVCKEEGLKASSQLRYLHLIVQKCQRGLRLFCGVDWQHERADR